MKVEITGVGAVAMAIGLRARPGSNSVVRDLAARMTSQSGEDYRPP
jgi:hypothetical protein